MTVRLTGFILLESVSWEMVLLRFCFSTLVFNPRPILPSKILPGVNSVSYFCIMPLLTCLALLQLSRLLRTVVLSVFHDNSQNRFHRIGLIKSFLEAGAKRVRDGLSRDGLHRDGLHRANILDINRNGWFFRHLSFGFLVSILTFFFYRSLSAESSQISSSVLLLIDDLGNFFPFLKLF